MKIKGEPKEYGIFRRKTNQLELYLTLNFNEQWQEILGGQVKFGIKGGELRLSLENGKSPYELRHLMNGSLVVSTDKEIEIKQSSENTNSVGSSLSIDKASLTTKQEDKDKINRTEKFKKTTYCIETKGSEEKPIWVFQANADELTIKGNLIDEELATIVITENTYGVKATFEAKKKDIRLTEFEGALPSFLHPNKHKAIENMIVNYLLKNKLKPYLSRAELRHE
ncbi:MAG: hypothetical protein KI793_29350 [Rivularia sp. (in: Bacteria)]|nr:hypothetical protein [Rivularia sp. MS3]